ncbi:MAG: DUF1326 domain-containing protein [Gemmataceae bacterium]
MQRCFVVAAVVVMMAALPVDAAGISGQYIEARTCDVYTGPCFANADTGLSGRHAVIGWKIEQGSLDNVPLDGLSVVAVVAASDTLGQLQTSQGRAIMIVDQRANAAQRDALLQFARQQAGKLLDNVIKVDSAPIDLINCQCQEGGCFRLDAGVARIETRCLDHKHDKGCGNESNYYPPLAKGVKANAAVAVEHMFSGTGFNSTWSDSERRGAYVGSFAVR